jgi:RNA-directed DNA polymerase
MSFPYVENCSRICIIEIIGTCSWSLIFAVDPAAVFLRLALRARCCCLGFLPQWLLGRRAMRKGRISSMSAYVLSLAGHPSGMQFTLQASSDKLREKFRSLTSITDVADLLEVDTDTLIYYLYRMPHENKYDSFFIPKKSGEQRAILSPCPSLKIIQQKLNYIFSLIYEPKICVHGFVRGRGIVANAEAHMGRRRNYVFNIDLRNFFPSINFGRVRGMFIAWPYLLPANVATILAQICCFDNQLPQGAPTSPMISNMICARLDSELLTLAKKYRCVYTRYADDITFSTSVARFPRALLITDRSTDQIQFELGSELKNIILSNGFDVNLSKIRLKSRDRRQEVTGLTVNDFPNVSRKFIRQIRAMLHAWEKFGLTAAEAEYRNRYSTEYRFPEKAPVNFPEVVRGKIEYVGMVRGRNDGLYQKLYTNYRKLLDPNFVAQEATLPSDANVFVSNDNFQAASAITSLETLGARVSTNKTPNNALSKSEDESRVFISYSRSDKEFVLVLTAALVKLGVSVWLDINDISPGSNWGTAIQEGLDCCTLMILVMTPASIESRNVANEWQYYYDNNKPIIPIRLKSVTMPYQLNRLQYLDFSVYNEAQQLPDLEISKLARHLSRSGFSVNLVGTNNT